jgi:hypothetical protein
MSTVYERRILRRDSFGIVDYNFPFRKGDVNLSHNSDGLLDLCFDKSGAGTFCDFFHDQEIDPITENCKHRSNTA